MAGKLEGRVAIVTGTSPNIGGGIAECLAEAGARIVAVDALAENSNDCAAAIIAAGGEAIGVQCDVTNENEVRNAVEKATDAFGAVDILVNNAATFNKKGLGATTYAEWQHQTSIILGGTFLFSKYAAAAMVLRHRGVIINIVSTAGHQGEPGNIAYGTAKGGLLNFTRSAAMELAVHGIRVVSLTPTATDPDEFLERSQRWGRKDPHIPGVEALVRRFVGRIPLRKLPRPSDYGRAAAFLASDDAAFITGSDLRVDGGAVGRYWAWDPRDEEQ